MKQDKLIACIEGIAPPALAEEWDNSGIQMDSGREEIKKALICLDITEKVVNAALTREADFIISHHPMIFEGLKTIDAKMAQGRMLQSLIKADISVYSAHMTYDKAPWGNSVSLAQRLGAAAIPAAKDQSGNLDYSFLIAEPSKPMTGKEFIQEINEKLQLPRGLLRFAGNLDLTVSKFGICAGSGGDFLGPAYHLDCQALLTGDVKHHQAIQAMELGMILVDAGHFDTERFFVPDFAALLRECAGEELEIIEFMEAEGPIKPFE